MIRLLLLAIIYIENNGFMHAQNSRWMRCLNRQPSCVWFAAYIGNGAKPFSCKSYLSSIFDSFFACLRCYHEQFFAKHKSISWQTEHTNILCFPFFVVDSSQHKKRTHCCSSCVQAKKRSRNRLINLTLDNIEWTSLLIFSSIHIVIRLLMFIWL